MSEDRLFKLLDQYARSHHHCFLSEFFRDSTDTDYVLCFRPEHTEPSSQARYACKYFWFTENELMTEAGVNFSGDVLRKLEDELTRLSHA